MAFKVFAAKRQTTVSCIVADEREELEFIRVVELLNFT
jgi:hypothetical protein